MFSVFRIFLRVLSFLIFSLLLASCSTLKSLKTALKATSQDRGAQVMFMVPVVRSSSCLESLANSPSKNENCTPWTRREHATPVVDASRGLVYVGGSDRKLHVMSARNGKLLRELKLDGQLSAKPLLDPDGSLYFGTYAGKLRKIDSYNLKILWERTLDAEILEGAVGAEGHLAILTGTSSLYYIDKKTGEIAWQQERPQSSKLVMREQASPLMTKRSVIVGHPSGRLDFYSRADGALQRSVSLGGSASFPDVTAGVILGEDSVYAASFNKGVFALDAGVGSVLWRLLEKGVVSMSYDSGMLYAAKANEIFAVSTSKGRKIWSFRFKKGAPTNLVIKGNYLYGASDRGPVFVLDKNTGQPQKMLGSKLGFAGDLDFSTPTLFAVSTAGFLFGMSPLFGGTVN